MSQNTIDASNSPTPSPLMNKIELWQAAELLRQAMLELGVVKLHYSQDPRELDRVVASLEKGALGEHFRASLHTLPPNRVAWITALDSRNNVIGLVAARLDDNSGWTLQDYIKRHFERCFFTKEGDDLRVSNGCSQFAQAYSGRCAYLGEGWIDPKYRRKKLASHLVRFLMLIVWDEWKPEVAYGWMRKRHAEKGMAYDWGFSIVYQNAVQFENEPCDEELKDAHFVANETIGIHQMILTIFRELFPPRLNDKE